MRVELVTFAQDQGCTLRNRVKFGSEYIPDYPHLVIGVNVQWRDSKTCLAKQMALATPFKRQLPTSPPSLWFEPDPGLTS